MPAGTFGNFVSYLHTSDKFKTDVRWMVALDQSKTRSSTQVWALCSKTRTLREADISWFRHVASEKRACSLGMRCVKLAARDSCAIFVSLAHRPVPPQRRGLWWPKWEKNGFTKCTRRTVVLGYECPDLCRRPWS